jgi:hypothetical protein
MTRLYRRWRQRRARRHTARVLAGVNAHLGARDVDLLQLDSWVLARGLWR